MKIKEKMSDLIEITMNSCDNWPTVSERKSIKKGFFISFIVFIADGSDIKINFHYKKLTVLKFLLDISFFLY